MHKLYKQYIKSHSKAMGEMRAFLLMTLTKYSICILKLSVMERKQKLLYFRIYLSF